ncbi:uncharacterized protein PITG_00358 [Phytophthora infestans T30-4]|uniref:Uncharacterized protein n=1 Tax=Phytophthora infestans (strain T30-4) TaxID=403677 RepID=D0MQL1_PHYIT|nr:uncharacterized protein PITG_00358 [Phytophthora infestans T30-4]EEY57780.1 conserved hypothetical protein [Phytophthora infestans T30-4]|eukprot:XP_002908966.1 conserved hypothetical protein [Phytophthora infestans T30-4]
MPPKKQRDKDAVDKQVPDNVMIEPRSTPTMKHDPVLAMNDHKKLKSTIEKHSRKIFDTVDDLRKFIMHSDGNDKEVCASVRTKTRLLWMASDTVRGLHFLRLYFGEYQAPEPLQQQQQVFKQAQQDDPFVANQFLISVSLLKVNIDDPKLPRPGDVVMITPYKRNVYRNCCQIDAKLYGLTKINIS